MKWTSIGGSIAQAIAYSGMLSHVEKHLVCLAVAGALTTALTCYRGQVATLRLCYALLSRVEIVSYACVPKKSFVLRLIFFVAITFLPINLCNSLRYL
jgi:hypothetical protein